MSDPGLERALRFERCDRFDGEKLVTYSGWLPFCQSNENPSGQGGSQSNGGLSQAAIDSSERCDSITWPFFAPRWTAL
jgi:hypothetical protein